MLHKNILLQKFLKAGVHIGHKTSFWNPKMKEYIFTKHNGIHIINLEKSVDQFNYAILKLKEILDKRGKILFVGTKNIVKAKLAETALKCKQFYINKRWLGGTLTNWVTLQKLIEEFKNIEKQFEKGHFDRLTKKEYLIKMKYLTKLRNNFYGIKDMNNIPDALFFIDSKTECLAIKESHKLKIKTCGIVDTDSNPDYIDVVIPGNDDSSKAIKLYLNIISNELCG